MKRRTVLSVLLAGVLSRGGSGADPVEQEDQKAIQGNWVLVSDLDGGGTKPIPDDLKITITKDKIIAESASRPKSEIDFKLDSATNPKSIDLTVRQARWPGIYELSGDTLTVCANDKDGGRRSTSFESKPDSHNNILMVFKRRKP